MMFISFAVKIHRSTITTVARPQLTGSGEPVTRAKQHYITGYIQWSLCNLQVYWLYISFLIFALLFFLWNPLVSLTMKTRQINAPKWSAKMTRQNVLSWQPAGFTRENNPPNLLARKTCHFNLRLACQRPPFPAQNPQARPGPPSLPPPPPPPPPPAAPPMEPGGGGREPAWPTRAHWTGTFTFIPQFMNEYTSLYGTIHTYSIQSGLYESINVLL